MANGNDLLTDIQDAARNTFNVRTIVPVLLILAALSMIVRLGLPGAAQVRSIFLGR